jgi:colicin import membrane protein
MKHLAALKTGGLAALCAALVAGCASEPEMTAAVKPSPTISVEQADQRIAAVARERAAIEARFTEREQVCYRNFFVTPCLNEAKERRRSALASQRAIEIDAEHFKRKAKVEERDRAMAEADAKLKAEEARIATEPPPPPRQSNEPPPLPPPKPKPVAERMARHQDKLKAEQAREAADADKRAASLKAYEERKRESEERQRKVAERKAQKAKEAQEKGKTPADSQ